MELVLKLDNFEGPLDLLIHLIEKKKLNIAEIKISQIIDEYLEYIESAKINKLETKIEFLEVASELLEIKALAVLSVEEEKEKEKKLKQRLETYKIIREIAQTISNIECEYNIAYSRKEGRKVIRTAPKEYDLKSLKLQDILTSFMKYIPKNTDTIEIQIEKNYSVLEEMERIKLLLINTERKIEYIFLQAESKAHIVFIFLALLDLYREGQIDINEDIISLIGGKGEL